jgi:hypothetical protein
MKIIAQWTRHVKRLIRYQKQKKYNESNDEITILILDWDFANFSHF